MPTRPKSLFQLNVIESDPTITFVISCHLLTEHLMVRCLSSVGVKTGKKSRFLDIITKCEKRGILSDDLCRVLRIFNSLRNRYAHDLKYRIKPEEINVLLKVINAMDRPFAISMVRASKQHMYRLLSGLTGHMELIALQHEKKRFIIRI